MNRKLLALAVAAAVSLPVAAQAAPTLYGLLNMSVDMVSTNVPGGADEWQVNSNSSRLGVMGDEALGNGLSAVYKAEWGVTGDMAGAAGSDFSGRDRYLGLKGSFGTVRLGAYDSPLKTSQGLVDQFNDMKYTDMASVGIVGDNRLNNAIGYTSPKLGDTVTLNLVIQPGENGAGVKSDSRLANAFSASAVFESGGLYAALGLDKDVTAGSYSSTPGDARDTVRLTGVYTAGAMQLGALLQTSQVSDDSPAGAGKDDQTALLLSAGIGLDDKNVVKGQVIFTKDAFAAGPDTKVTALELGFDHNFTKMTKAYAQAAYSETDFGGSSTKEKDSVATVGMQTKF